MYRNDILTKLKSHESELRQMSVVHIALFGLCAGQEERPKSHIDSIRCLF